MTVPILTGVKFDRRRELQKTIVTIEFTTLTLCRVRNFIEIEAFSVLRPKLWPKRWPVPTLTGIKNYKKLLSPLNSNIERCKHWKVSIITENYCDQWIQHLQIVHYVKFHGKWLTSFPVPRSPFPVSLFKDSQNFSKNILIIKFAVCWRYVWCICTHDVNICFEISSINRKK